MKVVAMPPRHVLAATAVMVVWGLNFVVIDKGLDGVPPLVFVALRFLVVALAVPFVARPDVPWSSLAAVGAAMSLGQFGLLYTSLAVGMPPGLASLVLQTQAILTVLIAALVLAERPATVQVAGVGIGLLGLTVVALGRGGQVPALALVLCLAAAASWAIGNVLVRRLAIRGGLGVTVWSGLVVPVPLLALSAVIDGPDEVARALTHLSAVNWASTAYTALLASLIGYSLWNWLLAQHPASTVAPFTLLVPAVGMALAWIVDGERPGVPGAIGGALLVLGVALVSVGPRLLQRARWPRAAATESG